jgi:hypothetical protein
MRFETANMKHPMNSAVAITGLGMTEMPEKMIGSVPSARSNSLD